MAVLKCKMCGGDLAVAPDKTFGTCEYCGCTMTLPRISDEQRASAFNRGNHFRRIGEFDKALAVYERIVREDDTDAEAHWCCALCRFGIEYVEDPATYEWLPTCHRASFDSFLEDVDYKAALEHSEGITRRQYMKDGAKIAEVQRGILAASRSEEPFDVFICYKESDADGNRTRESIMAQDIYYQLTEHGHRVFFSRITLEDVAGTQYEPYIFAALNSAKVMVVVGTSYENLNAVWVKNEWSRFLALMKKDRSKVLLPCYKDMDPYDLPEQLSVLQSYDMSKIGFIQDLIRGIDKVAAAAEPAPVSEVWQGSENKGSLLDRGYMALEDKEWSSADRFFEKVLNLDAKCARAYLGKLLISEACSDLKEFEEKRIAGIHDATPVTKQAFSPDEERIQLAIETYAVASYLPEEQVCEMFDYCADYESYCDSMEQILQDEEKFLTQTRVIVRFLQFANPKEINEFAKTRALILSEMTAILDAQRQKEAETVSSIVTAYEDFLHEADEKIHECRLSVDNRRRELYDCAVEAMKQAIDPDDYEAAAQKFDAIHGFADSRKKAAECRTTAQNLFIGKDNLIAETTEQIRQGDFSGLFPAIARYQDSAFRDEITSVLWDAAADRKTIAAAACYAAFLTKDETIRLCGKAENLQTIAQESGWSSVIALAVSSTHLVALRRDGTVLSTFAQMFDHQRLQIQVRAEQNNDRSLIDFLECCDVSGWTDVVSVAAGDYHTVGLRADGTVVAVGCNKSGQCNVSDWTEIIAVAAGKDFTVGLKADGTVTVTKERRFIPRPNRFAGIETWTHIRSIAASGNDIAALTTDGTVRFASQDLISVKYRNLSEWTDVVSISLSSEVVTGVNRNGIILNSVSINPLNRTVMAPHEFVVDAAAGNCFIWSVRCDGTLYCQNTASGEKNRYGAYPNQFLFRPVEQERADCFAQIWQERDEAQKQNMEAEIAALNSELAQHTGFFAAGKRNKIYDRIHALEQEIEKLALAHTE